MDMGEALDVNKELITVGLSNCKLDLSMLWNKIIIVMPANLQHHFESSCRSTIRSIFWNDWFLYLLNDHIPISNW
jgi:hypothetical protein